MTDMVSIELCNRRLKQQIAFFSGYETYVVVDASVRVGNITAVQTIDDMKQRGR